MTLRPVNSSLPAPAGSPSRRPAGALRTLSLSTCWNSSKHRDGEAMLRQVRSLGFQQAELSHAISYSLWPGIRAAVDAEVVKISSVHNFCPVPVGARPSPNAYEFTDPDPDQRRKAIQGTLDTMKSALAVRAPIVVTHLGWGGPKGISRRLEKMHLAQKAHSRDWVAAKLAAYKERSARSATLLARVKECLEPVVSFAGEHGLKLGCEIREAFEEFPNEEEMIELLAAFPPAVVGYWHDFGHAARKEALTWHTHAETLALRRERLFGCHIHDCRAPDEDHLPIGHGEIDFPALLPLLPPHAVTVLELSPHAAEEQVLASHTRWNSCVAALG